MRLILAVNQRASFDIVISENTLAEVEAKGERGYTSYAYEVFDHWLTRIDEHEGRAFGGDWARAARLDGSAFGYLSDKDKLLLKDALLLECDAFLTMEKKLPKMATHLEEAVGIRVLRPPDYWALLRPWAALWF